MIEFKTINKVIFCFCQFSIFKFLIYGFDCEYGLDSEIL